MLARLGEVLYGIGVVVSVLTLILAVYLWHAPGYGGQVVAVFVVGAGLVWLAGRAARFVLAGR